MTLWPPSDSATLARAVADAVVLKADTETGILSTHLHADGGKKELLWNPVGVSVGFKPEEHNAGVKVIVDPKSLPYIDGTELDFVREGLNEGFKFLNPREKDRCGCGCARRVSSD